MGVNGMGRETLTVLEVAHALGISRNLAYELARTGRLPTLRLGRRLVVPRKALERLLMEPGASATGSSPEQSRGQDR